MKVKSLKDKETDTARLYIQMETFSRGNSKPVSAVGPVCVNLQQLDLFIGASGEKTNLWVTECCLLCQTSLLKVDLMDIRLSTVKSKFYFRMENFTKVTLDMDRETPLVFIIMQMVTFMTVSGKMIRGMERVGS